MRNEIEHNVTRMKPGEFWNLDGRDFRDAYAPGFMSMYENAEQAFLSAQMGSAWGEVRVRHLAEKDVYVISKHEPSDKRYYADPDRAHLYERMRDGTLRFKSEE